MQRVFRPLAVFAIASAVSLGAGLQMMVGARGGEVDGKSFYPGYDLSKLEIAEPTLYYVDKNYVDATRIDWDAMFDAGLDAVERRVPAVLFTRADGARTLAVEVGDFRTVLEVGTIDDARSLQDELREVAVLLEQHLDASDVPANGRELAEPLAEVEYALVNGMLSTLDPHTILLEPDDAREMDLENQGEFGGLGITIQLADDDHRLRVECPMKGAPAARAGVRAGDRVLRIDGESTLNMSLDEAIQRLRGAVGDAIVLDVLHEGDVEPVPVTIVRELIPAKPVEWSLLAGAIGWIRISGFHEKVEHDLVAGLSSLHREAGGELRGLVLDLRGNPGGFLNQAVRVADTFLASGDIVSTVDGQGERTEPPETADRAAEPEYPIVVLVDASSASASEIVAGALRYNERAVVVGERTFGKGSVQNLHPFYDESKLKLTISRYLTPGDRSIQATGIPADIELVPSLVADDDPVHLFHRENLRREADLDRALEATTVRVDEAPYTVRYLEPGAQDGDCREEPDLANDPELMFSRDLLTAANGAWRRPDVLAAAAPVVASHRRVWNGALETALAARGVDWRDGPAWDRARPAPPLDVAIAVVGADGEGRTLRAGEVERLVLSVTNRSEAPLWRLAAVVRGNDLLEGEEFVFGAVAPGATATAEVEVRVPAGWPEEQVPTILSFRDSGVGELATATSEVAVRAAPLPAFASRWTLSDAEGDGDGLVDAGERLTLSVTVENVGAGRARSPYVRLRNRAGKDVELVEGAFAPQSPSGAGQLETGESSTGELHFSVVGAEAPAMVLLEVGDVEATDRSSWLRRAVSEEAGQTEAIVLTVGEPLPGGPAQAARPPAIDLTRLPPLRVQGGRVTLSGMVTDDSELADVMVFVGADKIVLESAGPGLRSLPFTADVQLEPGENVVSVVARDASGLVSTRSVVAWSDEAELARATPGR